MVFETARASLSAREGEGFDPLEVMAVIRDAGFTPRELGLRARGTLARHGELPALSVPTPPRLYVLAGGPAIDDLEAAGLPVGARVSIEGGLHPSHADRPPGLTVRSWTLLEPEESGGSSGLP